MENGENVDNNKNQLVIKLLKYIAILIIGILVIAGCMFIKEKLGRSETEKILDKISNIIILPNETPIINTIEDADGLRKESLFYENVQKGDKVLIFTESAKVIIYRENENKIVNVGPIINDVTK